MATRLPDGSVVVRVPGRRAVNPKAAPAGRVNPVAAKSGGGGKSAAVRGKQPGRSAVSKTAY